MNGLREVVVDCYTVVPRKGAAAESGNDNAVGALLGAAREIRRLCNVLCAFVRQDVRESRNGFIPGSDLEGMKYDPANNYFMDPCRPRIWDLLSEDETLRCVGGQRCMILGIIYVSAGIRPMTVSRITLLVLPFQV